LKNPHLLTALALTTVALRAAALRVSDLAGPTQEVDSALARLDADEELPRIVCLCGSTRFYDAFQKANFEETMSGRIVLSVGFYPHGDVAKTEHGEAVGITVEEKASLDCLHKRKIDLADEVFVLNVGGYIGDSTKSEVVHAWRTDKPVRWLEPEKAWKGHEAWAV
jgi:hypothetical protein